MPSGLMRVIVVVCTTINVTVVLCEFAASPRNIQMACVPDCPTQVVQSIVYGASPPVGTIDILPWSLEQPTQDFHRVTAIGALSATL
jgi:hypothetical protein